MPPLARPVEPLRLRLAEAGLAMLLALGPLALGGTAPLVPWALVLVSAFAIAAAYADGEPLRPGPLAGVFGLSAVACLLQLVPLPGPLLAALSPAAAQTRAVLGLPASGPISLDPPATARELAKFLGYLAAFFAAGKVATSRRARTRLFGAIAASGALCAVIGLGHLLVGADALFGAVHFSPPPPPLLTPFGNPNHLAGLLGLSASLAVGLALSTGRPTRAYLWAISAVLCEVGLFLSLSRGGIVCALLGQLLLAGWVLRGRGAAEERGLGRQLPRLGRGVGVVVALGGGALVAGWLAFERIWGELSTVLGAEDAAGPKLGLWPDLARATAAFFRSGLGRGAFETGFARFQTRTPFVAFTHAENLPFQLAVELGVPLALAVLGLGGWGLWRLARRSDLSLLELSALAGVLGLFLQNLVDFSLELPALGLAAAVVLGMLAREEPPLFAAALRGRRLRALGAAALVTEVLALVAGRATLVADEESLTAAIARGTAPEALEGFARPLLERHPADHVLQAELARANLNAHPERALAFAGRALWLRPSDPASHRIAGAALARLGRRGQALTEYRLAFEGSDHAAFEEGLALARGPDELASLLTARKDALRQLAARLAEIGREQEAAELLEERLLLGVADGERAELWLMLARLRVKLGSLAAARESLAEAEGAGAPPIDAGMVRASIQWAEGKQEESSATLAALRAAHPQSGEVAIELGSQLLARGKRHDGREVLEQARRTVEEPSMRARLLALEAGSYEQEAKWASALELYRTCARLEPKAPGRHYDVARMLEKLHLDADALTELEEGLRFDRSAGRADVERRVRALEKALGDRLGEADVADAIGP